MVGSQKKRFIYKALLTNITIQTTIENYIIEPTQFLKVKLEIPIINNIEQNYNLQY